MRLSNLLLFTLTVLPTPLLAAGGHPAARTHARSADDKPDDRIDLFGGFSHADSGDTSLNGWELSASAPFHESIRLAVDVARESGTFATADIRELHLMAGPGLAWRHQKLRPFARLLVGIARDTKDVDTISESHTNPAAALLGGTDYMLSHKWAVRGQVGVWFVHSAALVDGQSGSWDTDLHLSVGAVYRFHR